MNAAYHPVPDVAAVVAAADAEDWQARGVDLGLRRHAVDWSDALTEMVAFATSLYRFGDQPGMVDIDDPGYMRLNELVYDALEPIKASATAQAVSAIQWAVETFAREYPEVVPAPCDTGPT